MQLEKLLAYENVNQECQRAITPIHETRNVIDYLKDCRNLGSETQTMQMLAEAMAAAFKKGNEGCFVCGDKSHLKKNCPKNTHTQIKLLKNFQESALNVIKGYIGLKNVDLSMMLKGTLFWETQRWELPGSPSTKTRGKLHLFPQPSTSSNAAVNIPALNDFLLFPQAVPSRIPTGLCGPLPP